MRTVAARGLAVLVGTLALVVGLPGTASAHPLGNFTVNRYSGVVVATDAVTVDHVLDLAEIPTAQRQPAVDSSGDGTFSAGELSAWARAECADAASAPAADGGRRPGAAVGDVCARPDRCPARPGCRCCGWSARCARPPTSRGRPRSGSPTPQERARWAGRR